MKAKSMSHEEDSLTPTWDTTPLTMRKWLLALPEYLEGEHAFLVDWWQQGFAMSKHNIVAVPTMTHAVALRDDAVPVQTFEDPQDVGIFTPSTLPRGVRPLSSSEEKRFVVAPEYCRSVDRLLAKAILTTITVRAVRSDLMKRCNSSGLTLLHMLHERADEVGPHANTAIAGKLHHLMNVGPESRTVAAFNSWREQFDSWNQSQSIDAVIPSSLVAARYEAGARRLGEPLAERITNEIRLTGARGAPEKVVSAINTVFGDYEAELITAADAGGALSGHDPRRSGLGPVDETAAKNNAPPGPCATCGELHWHRDCPKRKLRAEKKKVRRLDKKAKRDAANLAKEKDGKSAQGNEASERSIGAAAVGMGEAIISEEFFEGGSTTVSITHGAGLVGLQRRPSQFHDRAANDCVSDEDSSDDTSTTSDSDEDSDSEEAAPLPPMISALGSPSTSNAAKPLASKEWAAPSPKATNYRWAHLANSSREKKTKPSRHRSDSDPSNLSSQARLCCSFLMGMNVALFAILMAICVRLYHDPGVLSRPAFNAARALLRLARPPPTPPSPRSLSPSRRAIRNQTARCARAQDKAAGVGRQRRPPACRPRLEPPVMGSTAYRHDRVTLSPFELPMCPWELRRQRKNLNRRRRALELGAPPPIAFETIYPPSGRLTLLALSCLLHVVSPPLLRDVRSFRLFASARASSPPTTHTPSQTANHDSCHLHCEPDEPSPCQNSPWEGTSPWAALSTAAKPNGSTKGSDASPNDRGIPTLSMVVDSGCVWHVVKDESLLVNRRPCRDSMYGADGVECCCTCIGDLPVIARNHKGERCSSIIRNVRCVPAFVCPMLSVRQLWTDSRIDTVFRDQLSLIIKGPEGCEQLPFSLASDRLYRWEVLAPGKRHSEEEALCKRIGSAFVASPIHSGHANSHVEILSAEAAGTTMHNRLHVSSTVLRRLPGCTSDAPEVLARCPRIPCAFCTEANATRTSHSHASDYSRTQASKSTRPGQLVFADVAGPFVDSALGGYKWALILVDDYSRYKWAYFMRKKSDAPAYMRTFIASFNGLLSRRYGATCNYTVDSIHTDNAGEFLSREFDELRDQELINLTTCPPHVHELNGVAERAIRAIFSMVRANMAASGAKAGLWTHMVSHSLDVLNRTTGPEPVEAAAFCSSFELLSGHKPKVMGIMPFGCRAFAVKPRDQFSKRTLDARAWVGYNLGRSSRSPGAYEVYIPSLSRIVTTSEVYFDESLMPLRPSDDQRIGQVSPSPPPDLGSSEPLGFSTAGNVPTPRTASESERLNSLRSAVHSAVRRGSRSCHSRQVLVLFSGPYSRPDGLAAFLEKVGLHASMVDNDASNGGDSNHDILDDLFFQNLLRRVALGEFLAVIAAPPCSTFSVARFFKGRDSKDGGPPPVRTRTEIMGIENVAKGHLAELKRANELIRRMTILLHVAYGAGSEFILENPADRGNADEPHLFLNAEHGPLWLMPDVVTLQRTCNCTSSTFAQCRFGCAAQKYTTFLHSPGFVPHLHYLNSLRCIHGPNAHLQQVGSQKLNQEWSSSRFSAFPADLNLALAEACADLIRSQVEESSARRPPHTRSTLGAGPGDLSLGDLDALHQHAASENEQQAPSAPDSGGVIPSTALSAPRTSTAAEDVASTAQRNAPDSPLRLTYTRTAASPRSSPQPSISHPPSPQRPASTTPMRMRTILETSDDVPDNVFSPGGTAIGAYESYQSRVPASASSEPATLHSDVPPTRVNPSGRLPVQTRARAQRPRDALVAGAIMAVMWMPPTSSSYGALVSKSSLSSSDPSNHWQAMAADRRGWTEAEYKELKAHRRNSSWSELDRADLPPGRKLVKTTWAYKTKRNGTLKARLCVQGCSQVPGVDFDQTHCATLRPTSLRTLAALSASLGLRMRRWDFTAAYLQGSLLDGEVVFCSPPPGYETHDEDGVDRCGSDGRPRVLRIEKPIYGMAQAGRRWQRSLFPWLLEVGLRQLPSEPCIFMRHEAQRKMPGGEIRDEWLVVGCYVDDLCVLYSHDDEGSLYQDFVSQLTAAWEVEDEGDVSDLLNVEISRDGERLWLRQTGYIKRLVETYLSEERINVLPRNQGPCDSSICQDVADALACKDSAEGVDADLLRKYQSLVGALLYCSTQTRPDVAYAVGMLCRVMSCPTDAMLGHALRVLRYLDRHSDIGLCYEMSHAKLFGMSDSDWAVKHSTSGWVFQYMSAAISWGSKKQPVVALSSCEAEIMAASEAAKEALHLRELLLDLECGDDSPLRLSVDNQSAVAVAYNPEQHGRLKHVERRHFFIRECVENMKIVVPFVATHDNLADFFTKPLPPKQFFALRNRIMNCG